MSQIIVSVIDISCLCFGIDVVVSYANQNKIPVLRVYSRKKSKNGNGCARGTIN